MKREICFSVYSTTRANEFHRCFKSSKAYESRKSFAVRRKNERTQRKHGAHESPSARGQITSRKERKALCSLQRLRTNCENSTQYSQMTQIYCHDSQKDRLKSIASRFVVLDGYHGTTWSQMEPRGSSGTKIGAGPDLLGHVGHVLEDGVDLTVSEKNQRSILINQKILTHEIVWVRIVLNCRTSDLSHVLHCDFRRFAQDQR